MPTYRFQSKELGVDYNIDFESEPTKKDFYDVLKTQVDTKQVANLIDSPKGKALAVDAYRHGFFDEEERDTNLMDIVGEMADSAWSGLGKALVDRPVIRSRTKSLAKKLGGIEDTYSSFKTGQGLVTQDIAREVDGETGFKLDQAGVRLLDRASILDRERSDFGDGMDYVQQSLAYVGLDPNDKNLQAEVARRAFRFSEATDRASLYGGLMGNLAGYRMLGSFGRRELSQSDWFKDKQSDNDIVEEIRHLREMQLITETLDRGAETMARVLGDTKTAQQIKKGLVTPDKDVELIMEMGTDPSEYIAPGVARTTQMTLRGLGTPGQIRRLVDKQKEAMDIKKQAMKDLAERQTINARSGVAKDITDASEEVFKNTIKDQNRVIKNTSEKLTKVLEKSGGPPSLQKGVGFATRATGYGADLVGRTAEFIYSAPKELAVDLLVKSGMTTEGAESLLKWGTGIGAGVTGASLISSEDWKPEWTDALIGAGILLGPRALQGAGTTLRHLGDYWSKGAGTRNMFEYLQQMDVAPKLSGAIIDRTTDSRMLPGVQEASKAFTKGETPGITGNFNKRQALPSGVRSFARGMTATGADKVASFVGRTGIAGATAMALPGAIGYATGGIEGMAGSIGASLPFIGLGLGSGELMRHKSKADLQIKQRGDVTAFRKNLDDIDGMLYDKLSFESKAGIASASIKYPDLEIGFYDAPGKANGFYDEPKVGNRSGKVMINVSGDAPLIGILSHEVGHHIMRHGMQPLIHEIFFGSVAKEKGGVFTAKDADGNPIIEYENGVPRYKLDEATFGKARDEYLSRLEDTQGVSEELRDQYTRNPEAILDEVVAEHVAHMLMKDKYGESILDKNVGDLAKSLFSAISGKGFIRDAGVGMGLASDEFGNGIFSAIEENSQLTKLVNDYNKLSERRSRQEMEDMIEESSSDVAVDATDLKSDAKLQDLFDGAIMRDDDGNIVRDVSGAPKLMTNGQMNKKQEQMSSDLSNLIDRMNDEDKADGHVIMRDTADGGRTGEGMFIDESIIDALAQGGNYSASQINFLRQASAIGRAISNGDITGNEVLMFYYPATRGGRKYKSLRGGFRSALIWGLQVSKAGNVNIQTLSLTGIEKNLSRMLKTKKYTKMLSEAFGAETNQGIRQAFNEKLGRYLENHHKGIENGKQGSGVSVEERNMINAMLGENVKMQGELNPVFARLGFRPETTIRSRRIDRIGTIQTTGKGAPVTYNGIKRNLMPRKGKDSQGQQTIDFGGPRRVSDESVDVVKIARDMINKLRPQSPTALTSLADRLSDEYNVAPSLFEEALFKQYWNSKGFLMPRLNGLQDNIGQALAESKQDKMNTEQLMSLLEKKAGAGALAKDIGLDKWAKEKGKFTKEEVATYVEENKIVIDVEQLDTGDAKYERDDLMAYGPVEKDSYNERLYTWKKGGFGGTELERQPSRYVEQAYTFNTEAVADQVYENIWDELYSMGFDDVVIRDMVTQEVSEDGKHLIEITSREKDFQKIKKLFEDIDEDIDELTNPKISYITDLDNRDADAVGGEFIPVKDHWDTRPNIIGHLRSDLRNIEGTSKRVLYIEELQSDTHQQGNNYGYQEEGEFDADMFNTEYDDTPPPVPDFPFKKNWQHLMLKDAMLQAYDKGVDGIAWANGRTHNNRYNLHKILKYIEVENMPGDDGRRAVRAVPKQGLNSQDFTIDKDGQIVRSAFDKYDGKHLSEVLGKPVAQRIIEMPLPEYGIELLRGKDLIFTDPRLPKFYDEEIVNIAKKYAKKLKVDRPTPIEVSTSIKSGHKGMAKKMLEQKDPLTSLQLKLSTGHNFSDIMTAFSKSGYKFTKDAVYKDGRVEGTITLPNGEEVIWVYAKDAFEGDLGDTFLNFNSYFDDNYLTGISDDGIDFNIQRGFDAQYLRKLIKDTDLKKIIDDDVNGEFKIIEILAPYHKNPRVNPQHFRQAKKTHQKNRDIMESMIDSSDKPDSWYMPLPKDRSKIENLGFYMPSLGKDEGNVPDAPGIVRDRANRFNNMSVSELRKSATETEQEWRKVASPEEPKKYTTSDDVSEFTKKRNGLVGRHKAINDALKFKSESARLMPAVPAELRPVDRIAREPGWADSPEMQAYLKDKGDPYFKLPQQKGQDEIYPEVFFHDGSIGLERENYPANYEFKSNAKGGYLTPIFMSTGIDFTASYGVPALRKYKGDVFPGAMDDTIVPVEGYDNFGPIPLITNAVNPFDFRNKDTIRKFVKEISELEYTTELQKFIDDKSNTKEWKNPHTSFNRITLNQFFKKSPGARIAELFYELRIPGYMDRMRGTIDEATNVIYDYLQSNVYRSATHEKLANEIKDSISNTPNDADVKEFTSNWVGIEGLVPLIKLAGFDSFTTMEAGTLNVGVFDSKNVKLLESVKQGGLLNSSWMGQDNTFRTNQEMITRDAKVSGNYDPSNPDIRMMPTISLENTKSLRNFMSAKGKPEFAEKDGNNYFPKIFYHGGTIGSKGTWVFDSRGSNSKNGETFLSTDYVFAKAYTGGWENVGNQNNPHATNDALQLITNVSNVFDSTNLDHGRKLRDAIVKDKGKRFMRNIDKYGRIRDYDFTLRDDTLAEIENDIFYFSPGQGQVPNDKNIVPYTYSDSEGNFDTYENWEVMENYAKYIKDMGHDAYTIYEDDNNGIVKNIAVFNSRDIKLIEPTKNFSGAKPLGSFNPANPDIRYMPKLDLPKDKSVQYKDSSNTIPIVFKPYSVLSGKKVSMVEADRHDTYYPRMGGPLHAFLQSNNVVAYIGDEGFRPMWANLTWQTISGMIGRIQATDEGHAMIQVMHEMAHRSNKDMFSRTLDSFEQNRANMSDDEINFCANIMDIVIQRNDVDADPILKAQKNFLSALAPYKNHFARGRINEGNKKFKEIVSRYKKAPWWQNPRVQSIASNFNNAFQDMTFNARAEVSNFFIPSDKGVKMPFAPDIKKLLLDEMDYIGAKREDVIGVVQLSKYNLDNSERVFGVYFGNDPEQAKWMTKNEEIIKDQLMKNPKFRPHPSYDWLMLGPANGDYFMFEKPVNPVKIAPDFAKKHEKNWRSKVATMRGDLIKKYGTDKIDPEKKPRQTKKEKKAIEKFLKEANKTPLPQQPSTNIVGAMLRSREPIKIK